jgi:sRNA-binding protein
MVERGAANGTDRWIATHRSWPPDAVALIVDWRTRWPRVFARPVPLAVGFSGRIKAAMQAEGQPIDRKALNMAIRLWTQQSAYLRAVARGEVRRNLDGCEAGLPDDAARQEAQRVLDERAARHAERERLLEAQRQAAVAAAG